jgi:hypothetical protein
MMIATRPSGLLDAAAMENHITIDRAVHATADRLFDILATGENQALWARGYRTTTWYGSTDHGVGTVRDVHLQWIVVRERFLAWTPGRRFAFSTDAASLPIVRSLIEDINFEPRPDETTLLRWTVHYTPALALRPIARTIENRFFRPMFTDFATSLARYAEQGPSQFRRKAR